MKNAVLIDFAQPSDWDFVRGLKDSTGREWDVEGVPSNRDHGSIGKQLLRYWKYFSLAIGVALRRREYAQIVSWQQFYGIIIAWFSRLFRLKNVPDVYIMTFIYKDKKGVIGRIYKRFIRYALHAECVKKVICFSGTEPEYYSKLFQLGIDRFASAVLGIEDASAGYEAVDEGYYLSAGRSNRDYRFMTRAWKEEEDLYIISDSISENGGEGIKVFDHCYGEDFLRMLSACHAVIIPLEDENISSGQLVILQAFMFGKPVIATSNITANEYVSDGVNGYIIPKTDEALHEAVRRTRDPETYKALSEQARNAFTGRYSMYSLGASIGKITAH